MRSDAIGLFWQDLPRKKGDKVARIMPPIPETGWVAPTEFPDLRGAAALAVDVETYDPELKKHGPGWARGKGHICGIAVGVPEGHRWYFPIRHTIEKEQNLDPEHVIRWARDQLTNPNQPKIGANITYDIGWLRQEGIHVQGRLHDVQFAESILKESATVNLDDLGERYLGRGKETNLLYEWCSSYYGGKPSEDQRKNIYRAPPRLVGPYAQGDVDLPFHVLERQWPLLLQQGLMHLYDMECELIYLMVEMRFAGVTVDLNVAEELREQMVKGEEEFAGKINHIAGMEVNVNAAASIAEAFDALGIRYTRTSKGTPSFTKGFLKTLDHPIGPAINELRARKKFRGTFIEGYILNSHVNGKLYGSFHQLRGDDEGARSGRFSSSAPNLQNIPQRSKLGKQIRRCFIPDPGHRRWRKGDYSQIEYRSLAHYAIGPQSDLVRQRYNEDPNVDFHEMLKILVLEITGQDHPRDLIKNVNFGTLYGMGKKKLARYLNLSDEQAQALFDAIHAGAPFMRATMDATMEEARYLGYITTILGRRSRFDLWVPGHYDPDAKPVSYDMAIRQYSNPERAYLHKALNRRLQGSAADLLKAAMLKCWKDGIFHVTGVPRLTVHDELDFSDTGETDEAFAEMTRVMETAIQLRVPVKFENELGPNWGEVEKVAA